MRRNWDDVLMLLDVSHKLAGHPNLKQLRDEALEDLNDILARPPELPEVPAKPEPEIEPEPDPSEPVNEAPVLRRKV